MLHTAITENKATEDATKSTPASVPATLSPSHELHAIASQTQPGWSNQATLRLRGADGAPPRPAPLRPSQSPVLHRSVALQPKLMVNPGHDAYEQEADRVAEQVMRMPTPPAAVSEPDTVQRQTDEEDELVQTKLLPASISPLAPRATGKGNETGSQPQQQPAPSGPHHSVEPPADFAARLQSSGSGSPLPPSIRAFMEPRFGADFSEVRLHTGSEAAQLNRAVDAHAFTHGPNIYLGVGKHNLESSAGQQLLAHELTHTIQQGAAGALDPAMQLAHLPEAEGGRIQRDADEEDDRSNLPKLNAFYDVPKYTSIGPPNPLSTPFNPADNFLRQRDVVSQSLFGSVAVVLARASGWSEERVTALGEFVQNLEQLVLGIGGVALSKQTTSTGKSPSRIDESQSGSPTHSVSPTSTSGGVRELPETGRPAFPPEVEPPSLAKNAPSTSEAAHNAEPAASERTSRLADMPRLGDEQETPSLSGNNKPNSCFVAGTLVLTPSGEARVQDLVIGDEVLSTDPCSGARTWSRVRHSFVRVVPEVLDIKIKAVKITCSPEHPFWVPNHGWQTAKMLKAGTQVLTRERQIVEISSVSRRYGGFQVYNLEVEGLHTYHVSKLGILVHNKALKAPEPVGDLKLRDDRYLRRRGIDPHDLKHGSVPGGSISEYDIYEDQEGKLFALPKKKNKNIEPTYLGHIDDRE